MSMEHMRALLRAYTPGRKVRFKPDAQAVMDKVPPGIEGGTILQILPLPASAPAVPPSLSSELVRDPLPLPAFAVEIEFDAEDAPDSVVLGLDDVELETLSLDALLAELWHREVRFARSSGIGIAFPPGASDDGLIEHVRFRRDEAGRQTDLALSLSIPVDPEKNPEGINVFYAEADFTQCQLRRRQPPASK